MDDKEINIIDSYKIDDSHSKIRGIVSLYDEKGNLIFTKENMILKAGRRAIFNALFDRDNFNMPEIIGAAFGNNSEITTPDMVLDDMMLINNEGKKDNPIIVKADSEGDNFRSETNENNSLSKLYIIKLSAASYNNINNRPINCMGLLFNQDSAASGSQSTNDSDENNGQLFSRVVFPAQYVGSNRTLIFKYYLYF